jgi:hypothetical protein
VQPAAAVPALIKKTAITEKTVVTKTEPEVAETTVITNSKLSLNITNNKSLIEKDRSNIYSIDIQNKSDVAIASEVSLSVQLPGQLVLQENSQFQYDQMNHEAFLQIGELLPTQSQTFKLHTKPVENISRDDNQASVRARVSYNNGITTTSSAATDSDEIETEQSLLGALSIGSIDFQKATLWVLGVALLLAVLLSARAFKNQSVRIARAQKLRPKPVAMKQVTPTYRYVKAKRKEPKIVKPTQVVYKRVRTPLPYSPIS